MGTRRVSPLNAAPRALRSRDGALPSAAVGRSREGPWVLPVWLPSPSRNPPAPRDAVLAVPAARVAAGGARRSSEWHRGHPAVPTAPLQPCCEPTSGSRAPSRLLLNTAQGLGGDRHPLPGQEHPGESFKPPIKSKALCPEPPPASTATRQAEVPGQAMPRSALKPSQGQQESVHIPCSELGMHAAPEQEAANRRHHPRARSSPSPPPLRHGPATSGTSNPHGGGRGKLPPAAAARRGRLSRLTATPQAISNPRLGMHMLQPCPGKNQQHGGLKHPGQPRLRHGVFCTIPSESCWEELGGTAGLLCPQGGTAQGISQNPPALKHPQSPWSQRRAGPGCWEVPPWRAQGKGLARSVGVGTSQGPRGDHLGTTRGG